MAQPFFIGVAADINYLKIFNESPRS